MIDEWRQPTLPANPGIDRTAELRTILGHLDREADASQAKALYGAVKFLLQQKLVEILAADERR